VDNRVVHLPGEHPATSGEDSVANRATEWETSPYKFWGLTSSFIFSEAYILNLDRWNAKAA